MKFTVDVELELTNPNAAHTYTRDEVRQALQQRVDTGFRIGPYELKSARVRENDAAGPALWHTPIADLTDDQVEQIEQKLLHGGDD